MIVGIVGLIGSGKDTVANLMLGCDQVVVSKCSFADPLKDVCAAIFGWPRHLLEGDTDESREYRETPDVFWTRRLGIPHFTPRLALQLIGTDVLRNHFHKDIWLNSLEYKLMRNDESDMVVISDARFSNELALITNMGGKIIWVQRGEMPEWYETAVDANKGNAVSRKIMTTKYRDIHESEWNWVGHPVDYVIKNDGTMDDLRNRTREVVTEILDNKFAVPSVVKG